MLMGISCIPVDVAARFINDLDSNALSNLATMSPKKRRALLEIHFGKDAKELNAKIEGKLILKNQQLGLERWVNSEKGASSEKKKGLLGKIERMEKALDMTGKDPDFFLSDLVESKLGISVTAEEGQKLLNLSEELAETKEFTKEYGDKRGEIEDFMDSHVDKSITLSQTAMEGLSFFTRGLLTTGEFSAFGRQGFRYMGTVAWFKAVAATPKYFTSKNGLKSLRNEMFASKHFDKIEPNLRALGATAFGKGLSGREEDTGSRFMQSFGGEKLGKWGTQAERFNLLAAFSRSYEGFLTHLRFKRMEQILTKWEKTDNPRFKEKKSVTNLAKVISTNSGRGSLGNFALASSDIAAVAFSARFFAAQVQQYTNVVFGGRGGRAEAVAGVRMQAVNTAAAMTLAASMGATVEDDPLSADWGKVCWGNTCIDVTGGSAALMRLIVRTIRMKTKSAKTGAVRDLTGDQVGEVISDFLGNKKSPALNTMNDFLIRRRDFDFNEISLSSPYDVKLRYFRDNLITPMIVSSVMDAESIDNPDDDISEWAVAFAGETIGGAASSFDRTMAQRKLKRGKSFWEKLGDGENPFFQFTSKARRSSR